MTVIQVDPDWWKALFDDIYLVTDARSVCNAELTRCEVKVIRKLLPIRPEDRILDLCGGHGRHSLELSRQGFRKITVVDYSESLLNIGASDASLKNRPVRFVRGDARNLELDAGAYHHVLILGNSLGYGAGAEDDLRMLRESRRVLKSGGWLLVDVTNGDAVRRRFAPNAWHEIGAETVVCRQRELQGNRICARELVLNKTSGMVRDQTYSIRLYSLESLMGLVEKAGFLSVRGVTDFAPFKEEGDLGFMNHRMIVTACKP
ncbi:MAG: class I SAM-dependent methyltransferase [Desulfobacterales bacterium]